MAVLAMRTIQTDLRQHGCSGGGALAHADRPTGDKFADLERAREADRLLHDADPGAGLRPLRTGAIDLDTASRLMISP